MKKREMKGRPREMRRKQGLWRGKEEEQRKRSEWKSELDNRKKVLNLFKKQTIKQTWSLTQVWGSISLIYIDFSPLMDAC